MIPDPAPATVLGQPVAGLVAAAGRSSRMGRPKALLPLGDTTFARALTGAFAAAGLAPLLITLPEAPDDAAVRGALHGSNARLTANRFMEEGLSGSVRTALGELGSAGGLVLCPVDMPFATPALVRRLIAALEGAPAAVPVVDGARGHPVAFRRDAFALLADADRRGGPRGVLDALGAEVAEVPADDPRLTMNINSPPAYEAATGRPLPAS